MKNETQGMVAMNAWLDRLGRSGVTGWRWAKAGLIHPINIFGKLYLTAEDITQFEARAAKGEFARRNPGAEAMNRKEEAAA